jgi:hypothetical protein
MRDLSQPRDFNVRAAPYLGNGCLSRPSVNYQSPLLMLRHGKEWEEDERRRKQQIFQQTIAHILFLRDIGFRPSISNVRTTEKNP